MHVHRICLILTLLVGLVFSISPVAMSAETHTQVGYGFDAMSRVRIGVFMEGDKPVPNAIVVVKSPGAFETTYRTDEEGVFTAIVPCKTNESKSITHEVVVTHDKYKTATKTFTTEDGQCDKVPEVTFRLGSK